MQFIETLEEALAKKTIKKMIDMQAGDVKETSADTSELNRWVKLNLTPPLKKALSDLLTGLNLLLSYFFLEALCAL
jgi:UDP-glucuronate 4-epimerase